MKTFLRYIFLVSALMPILGNAQAADPAAESAKCFMSTAASSVLNVDTNAALSVGISPIAGAALSTAVMTMPLQLTASDLVSKVYGVLDTGLSRHQAEKEIQNRMKLSPSAEDKSLWLDSAGGYRVSYYGMMPELSAVAYFDDDAISGYCYFFIFPYTSGNRESANVEQSLFTGSLLQEMNDVGLIIGMPDITDYIFEAMGSYQDKHIHVGLVEEANEDESGRFVLGLDVIPGSYTHNDAIMAGK